MPTIITTNTRALVGWLVVLGISVGLAILTWTSAEAQSEAEPVISDSFAVESYALVCARCHGLNGGGGVVPGDGRPVPALTGNPEVTIPYMDLVMLTGRMPPAGDPFDNRAREVFYTDAERAAMVAWMAQEFGLEGVIPQVTDGDVARGLEVFARNCAACHGNAGAGGTAGQRAWTPQVNNRSGVAILEAIRVGPFQMPAFGDDVISQRDASSVVAYLNEVEEGSGTPFLGLVELNPVFAAGFVGLLAFALLGSLVFIAGRPVALEGLVTDGDTDEESSDQDADGPEPPAATGTHAGDGEDDHA